MKSVLVTGGASGLGLALVHRFLEEGWAVGVLDRRPELPESLMAAAATGTVLYESGDAADPAAYERLVSRLIEQHGRLDSLVANAAIWDFSRALLDMTATELVEGFDELFNVNVKGYLVAAHATAPELAKSAGSMVFTLSNAALYPGGGGPLYTASKHAGVGIVRQLAHELAPEVRVNAVAPAGMATGLSGPRALGEAGTRIDEVWDGAAFAQRVPLAFVPGVDDYVESFVFLADRTKSRAVTGVILPVELGLGVRGIRSVSGGVRRAADN